MPKIQKKNYNNEDANANYLVNLLYNIEHYNEQLRSLLIHKLNVNQVFIIVLLIITILSTLIVKS